MVIGFTGTREDMSQTQLECVTQIVRELGPSEVHHGCCVGADAQFHEAMFRDCLVVGYPGPTGPLRATLVGFAVEFGARDYGARNQTIVNVCDVLIAAPAEMAEAPSGGTWQTVRRARAAGKRVVIVWPDGRST